MSTDAPPPLGAAPETAALSISDAMDFLAVPACAAVVVIETADGRAVLIATTADARELARKRLSPRPAEPDAPRSVRVDCLAIATGGTLRVFAVGSSLEADAVYMHQARARLPHLARIVGERRRAWFVHVDPEAEFPQWTKTNLAGGLVGKRSASAAIGEPQLPEGFLLGPLPDKDSAGSFIEKVIDCFDLCRFHNLLVQAPRAVACAYKEMGRCDAPCDGSEEMERYRRRTLAAAMQASPPTEWIGMCESALKAAIERQEFEKAAKVHRELARLKALDRPAYAHIRDLKTWRDVVVLPGAKRGRATVALFDRGTLWRIGDVDPADESTAAPVARMLVEFAGRLPKPEYSERLAMTPEKIDTFGVVARWLFLAKAKRRGLAMPVPEADHAERLLGAAREVVKRKKTTEPEVETQEIEGE